MALGRSALQERQISMGQLIMDKTILIISMMLLLIILLPLVTSLVFSKPAEKKATKVPSAPNPPERKKGPRAFEELRRVIKSKKSSTAVLKEALDELLLHYGKIPPKLGIRSHPDFDYYRDILFAVCRHPNIDKDILLAFDRGLREKNSQYRREIDEAVKGGLESRGM